MKKYLLTLIISITFLFLAFETFAGGTWTGTGPMNAERRGPGAMLLPDGKVLISGGRQASIAGTSSAEIYNPVTNTWSTTGSMTVGRSGHAVTLLSNGQVLIVGGYNDNGRRDNYLSSVEIYNPATGTWTLTGSMHNAGACFSATLLPNGQVLVAGGHIDEGWTVLSRAELYNPTTGIWTLTGSMNTVRTGHTATLLPNGKVLVAGGGVGGHSITSSAEIYDPATGTWTPTGSMHTTRGGHAATLLPNGKVLVTGGVISGESSNIASAEIYDPATGTWALTGSMSAARAGHTTTLLTDGRVLVAGGSISSFSATTSSAEIYDPATGIWTLTGSMNTVRSEHTATLLTDGRILVAAGWNGSDSGYITSGELYDPGVAPPTATATATATPTATPTIASDYPILSTVSKTGTEGNTITFSASDFINSFTDPDGYGLSKIKITSLPDCYGSLKLLDKYVKVGDEISPKYLGDLTFVPNSNWKGGTATFKWNGSNGNLYALNDSEVSITITDSNWWIPWTGGGIIGATTTAGAGFLTYMLSKHCHHNNKDALLKGERSTDEIEMGAANKYHGFKETQ